jgi:hypothetical protein
LKYEWFNKFCEEVQKGFNRNHVDNLQSSLIALGTLLEHAGKKKLVYRFPPKNFFFEIFFFLQNFFLGEFWKEPNRSAERDAFLQEICNNVFFHVRLRTKNVKKSLIQLIPKLAQSVFFCFF